MFEARELMVFYENMLALNNVGLKCGPDQIVGLFGANSAGKSTLMYVISGIMLDIKRKEEMAGGERITVLGQVTFEGQDLMGLKPSRQGPAGDHPLPGKAPDLPGKHGPGKSGYRRLPGFKTAKKGNPGLCF